MNTIALKFHQHLIDKRGYTCVRIDQTDYIKALQYSKITLSNKDRDGDQMRPHYKLIK